MLDLIFDWKSNNSSDWVRWKRMKFAFSTARSLGVRSKSAPTLPSTIPGFTKLDLPSSLLERRSGRKLSGDVSATPVPVRRMPSRLKKLNMPPAKVCASTMESNPLATVDRGSRDPEAKKNELRKRIQSLS